MLLLHHEEYDVRAEKAFTKWLPGIFSTLFHSLAKVYICIRGYFEVNVA